MSRNRKTYAELKSERIKWMNLILSVEKEMIRRRIWTLTIKRIPPTKIQLTYDKKKP